MKKSLKTKKVLILIVCIIMILLIINKSFATSEPIIISGNEYESIQETPTISGNSSSGNTSSNNSNNSYSGGINTNNSSNNSAKRYNNTNISSVPQTGIEDYNIGILLIIAVASAMYAYKKIKDYNNL